MTTDHVEPHRLLLPAAIAVRVTMSDQAWAARVPSLILQPLIENAFVHALSRVTDGGWLTIAGSLGEGRLAIEIANAVRDAEAPSRGLSSGLTNVRERLEAWHDGSASLAADRRPDRFVVRIDLPHVSAGPAA